MINPEWPEARRALVEKHAEEVCPQFKQGFIKFNADANCDDEALEYVAHVMTKCPTCDKVVAELAEEDQKLLARMDSAPDDIRNN